MCSGSVAGMATVVVVTPLDTARTRLQASSPSQFTSGWHVLLSTWRNEGARALYKGMSAPLVAQGVYKMTAFSSFGLASRQFASPPSHPAVGFACGAFAGLVNSFVVTPVELVRNRLAVQRGFTHLQYSGPTAVLRDVSSVRQLFRGLPATMTRDFAGMGMWFATFHYVRQQLADRWSVPLADFRVVALSGACSGVAFWTVALPFDSVKTLMQTTTTLSFAQALQATNFPDQYRRLYTLCLARGIPAASIAFSVQTAASNWIDAHL